MFRGTAVQPLGQGGQPAQRAPWSAHSQVPAGESCLAVRTSPAGVTHPAFAFSAAGQWCEVVVFGLSNINAMDRCE
jgi:hypothetical protein